MPKAAVAPQATAPPSWFEMLRSKFMSRICHTFILTGNVRDLVDTRNTINNFLQKLFIMQGGDRPRYDIVAFYDRSKGLTFAFEEMEKAFMDAVADAPASNATPEQQKAIRSAFGGNTTKTAPRLPGTPVECFAMVEKVLSKVRFSSTEDQRPLHMAFIIDYAETIFPAGEWASLNEKDRDAIVRLLNWAKDKDIQKSGNPIILITDSAMRLHDSIVSNSSRIEQIEIMLPGPEDRLEFIESMDRVMRNDPDGDGNGLQFSSGFNKNQLVNLTAGLKRLNLEDIKLSSDTAGVPISPELVKARKKEIMSQEYQSILEVVEPEFGFESVGGMDWLKTYLLKNVVAPMLDGDLLRCPKGLLFSGSTGTGKTWLAKALAKESRMNMVNLNIGKLLGSLVGQSEQNMEKFMLAIRSLVPVMVFIDEIDQSVTRGTSGDSGVSNRLFRRMLEIMSDPALRGKVMWIAATNRPDMLDPALKASHRFDKKIPFLLPEASERAKIFAASIRYMNLSVSGKIDFEELGDETEKWSAGDVTAAIVKAYELTEGKPLTQNSLERAVASIKPNFGETELWTTLALLETNDIDLLPPHMRSKFSKESLRKNVKTLTEESTSLQLEERRKVVREF